MTIDDLLWVAEVRTCGVRKANLYFAHGYKLIGVGANTTERERRVRPENQPENVTFIERNYLFIVARDADTPRYDPDDEVKPQEAQ